VRRRRGSAARCGCGSRDHDVAGQDASGAIDHLARFFNDRGRYADEIARDERHPLAARRDHDRLRVKIVVDAGREARSTLPSACRGAG
jgi:hypothetical protein